MTVGASDDLAFYLVAVINGAAFFGRVIPGLFVDSMGPETIVTGAYLTIGILGLAWIGIHSLAGFVVFLVLYGFATGIVGSLAGALVFYLCPSPAVYGTRVGMIYSAGGAGFLVGLPSAAALSTGSRGFLGAQLWMGIFGLVAGVGLAVFVLPTVRKARLQQAAKAKASAAVEPPHSEKRVAEDSFDSERGELMTLPVIPKVTSISSEWMEYNATFESRWGQIPRSSVRVVRFGADGLKISPSHSLS